MANMFQIRTDSVRLLDAGAGAGSLSAAFISEMLKWKKLPKEVSITAFELDKGITRYLRETLTLCCQQCERMNIRCETQVIEADFIASATAMLQEGLFSSKPERFNFAILNPPYRKINSDSETRKLLRSIRIETSNLYTAFLALIARLLEPGGELVAITPRSFCNGPYFKPFREEFLREMTFRKVHVFESRSRAFHEDKVLQENIIFQVVKKASKTEVTIVSSHGPEDTDETQRKVGYDQFVYPNDPDCFIHLVSDELGNAVAERMGRLKTTLEGLGLTVSTGRVVDFRAKEFLRSQPEQNTAPLIYPGHFSKGFVRWPVVPSKKPNALVIADETKELLIPSGPYVLVKRFSAKEEARRVVAAVFETTIANSSVVAFENHLNYFHIGGQPIPPKLARGLAAYLNSTLVDSFFRQFNGHTQVNATDLRSLRYPSRTELESLGRKINGQFPSQQQLDDIIEEELFSMSNDPASIDPIRAKHRVNEALAVLKALDLPKAQQNERSALTILALLDLRPATSWTDAGEPLRGITQMMDFFAQHYGKTYKPNTRESVRKQTVHQFLEAGIICANPDVPDRPINSGKTVYQVVPPALRLFRSFGTKEWERNLKAFLSDVGSLRVRYSQEREKLRIPVMVSEQTILLSPGGQNVLLERILNDFCGYFTPGARVLYIGDTDTKFALFEREELKELGVTINKHGKMPDVVVHYKEKNWLVLIEAVTSHGPVDAKRKQEMQKLFKGSSAGLVYVTAFLTRKDMVKYLNEISWETEVWTADAPTHMIHLNGERFLGPY